MDFSTRHSIQELWQPFQEKTLSHRWCGRFMLSKVGHVRKWWNGPPYWGGEVVDSRPAGSFQLSQDGSTFEVQNNSGNWTRYVIALGHSTTTTAICQADSVSGDFVWCLQSGKCSASALLALMEECIKIPGRIEMNLTALSFAFKLYSHLLNATISIDALSRPIAKTVCGLVFRVLPRGATAAFPVRLSLAMVIAIIMWIPTAVVTTTNVTTNRAVAILQTAQGFLVRRSWHLPVLPTSNLDIMI